MMKKRTWLLALALCLSVLIIWAVRNNAKNGITEYCVGSSQIPNAFDGFRIAQVSDLHNAVFGDDNGELLGQLSQTNPDLIVVTGDLIDSRRTDLDVALDFIRRAVQIAPVYYVTGNHEARVPEYGALKEGMLDAGVTVLEDYSVTMNLGEDSITIMGIHDPSFHTDYLFGDGEAIARQKITSMQTESDGFTVLLSHRPELFDVYVEAGIDLVFSGHAHGGQFRLPIVGGLAAPNQGFFPEYDAGQFTEKSTTMIVSRGVGNSIIPLRINNPPEIVVAELKQW